MSYLWALLLFASLNGACSEFLSDSPNVDSEPQALEFPESYPAAYNRFFYLTNNENDVDNQNNYDKSYYTHNKFDENTLKKFLKQGNLWVPNVINTNDKIQLKFTAQQPLVDNVASADDSKVNFPLDVVDTRQKKNFSPWGGKRGSGATMEHSWTWKRSSEVGDSILPKRVRFSPWGGKRNGHSILKPGQKNTKLISSPLISQVSKFGILSPHALRLEDYKFIPVLDKRHPIKILALSSRTDKAAREALPFKYFMETLPKLFKPGHPYADVNVKKDGKRKVKFSSWGGKRSPPIIGPIWTPASQDIKDAILNAIVIIRNLGSAQL